MAFFAAMACSVFAFLLVLLFTAGRWLVSLAVFALMFAFAYYIFKFLLERFIYRKIKVIYKLISREQENMKLESAFQDKTIDEVRDDVLKWAGEKRIEISRLQHNESFRKEFLMNLAHELRTPIFSIQGYIATLLDGEINNPEVNVRFLENAARSADRLSNLVDQLKEISHYESHRVRLEKSSFSIQKNIKKVFAELKPLADEKEISMSIKKGCEGDFLVWADKMRIEQVLINLIQNAIKYGKKGGHVLAGVYTIDDRKILVEIADNGVGMDQDQSIRVFERFFRTDEARTIDKHGHGLGLSIVKHIVEAHKQTIQCRSQKGLGTTFSFTLERDRD